MRNLNLSFIVRLIDKMSAPARAMTATIARAEAPVRRANAVIGAWGTGAEKSGRQSKLAAAQSLDLGKALASIDKAARAYSLDPMRKQVMASDKAFNLLPRSVRNATAGLAQFYAGTRRVKEGLAGLPAMIKSTDKMMERLSNATIVTDGMARRGQAMIAPFRAANTAAGDFERGMKGIGITASMTDAQLVPIQANIMRLSREMNMMPNVVQDTFGKVLAEGVFKGAQEINTASEALVRFQRLASAGGDELSGDDGGALLSGLRLSLGLKADQMDRAFAMINQSSKDGGVTNTQLARGLPAQLAQMKAYGGNNMLGFADLLAANQVAKVTAGQGAAASNNINNLFTALGSAETQKNFDDLGMNLEGIIKGGVARGLSPLEAIAEKVKEKSGGDKFRIAEMFGDMQAQQGILALVQNMDDFKAKRDAIMATSATGGTYGADQARINNDSKSSAEAYEAAQARLAISTGKILAPAFTWAANMAEKFADWLVKLEEGANPIGRIMVGAAAGVGIFMAVAGSVGSAVTGMLGPILIIKKVMPFMGPLFGGAGSAIIGFVRVAATAMMSMGSAMFASPIGWIVLLITAIAGAAYLIIKNWDTVKAWFGTFWNWMMTSPMAWLLGPITLVVRMGAWIVKNWDVVLIWFGKFWAWMMESPLKFLAGPIAGLIGAVGLIIKAWEPIKAFFSDLWDGIKNAASSALEAIMGWLAPILSRINNAWSDSKAKLDQAAEEERRRGGGGFPPPAGAPPPRGPLLANTPAGGAAGGTGGASGRGRPPANVTNNWNITAPNAPAVQRAVQRTPQARGALHD
jgi:hypothetical protein